MPSSDQGGAVPFKDFQQLSPVISLYHPSNPTTKARSPTSPSPALIILTPWLSAQPHHIAKYTDAYQSLFPYAAILVIRTTAPDMVYRPYKTQQGDLKMLLHLLQIGAGGDGQEILLHMFSNAGAHKASQIARAYQAHSKTALKCGAMVFDSTPGVATYSRIVDAMTIGLPAIPVLQQLLACLVHFLVGLIWLQSLLSGGANLVERARIDLNDPTVVQSTRGRLYLYSSGDRMVASEDVESHALEAEKNGECVRRGRRIETPHVGHMANDGRDIGER